MAKDDAKYEEMKRLKEEDTNEQNEKATYGEVLKAMRETMDNWHEERVEKDFVVPPAPRKKKPESE